MLIDHAEIIIRGGHGGPGLVSFGKMKKTGKTITELKKVDQVELLCKGGKGGRGNWEFRGPRNTTPKQSQPGLPGQAYECIVELSLIAQYGLIGLPNAGKSSLLNEITN